MSQSANNYCLILAGGMGSRLWPASQEKCPKQFIDFEGTGRTLIQQTYDRFVRFIDPSHIFISTQAGYIPLLKEQLPEVPRHQILAEPVRRGTLAPVTWGTSAIANLCPDACIVVTPSDQEIRDDEAFSADIRHAMDIASSNEGVITLGVIPTRPDTGYGYVQMGEPARRSPNIFRVKAFTEKPDEKFAQIFMDSGEFLWNTGLFVFGAQYMLNNIVKHVPEFRDDFPEMVNLGATATTDIAPDCYTTLPNLSLEYALLEHTQHRYVQRCHFGWADVGTWQGIATDAMHTSSQNSPHPPTDVKVDGRQNVTVHSEALFDNAHGNIVRLPSGHLAVVSGLDNFVIAEEDGIIMICPKDDPNAMRRLQTLTHLDTLEAGEE
ncbi:MAG: mannose-1-phosphate guanylyltransferase [Bacteroidaceae bacterium]|nr:mannose-1-phosphate guanylyltransferase [Bacteroidaceae bacterium]